MYSKYTAIMILDKWTDLDSTHKMKGSINNMHSMKNYRWARGGGECQILFPLDNKTQIPLPCGNKTQIPLPRGKII